MEKKIKKHDQANYEIQLTITAAEQDAAKATMLKHFQKDFEMAGFRKGAAPLEIVEQNTKPEYLTMGIYEHLINQGLQAIVKENEKLRFIGEPYDLKQEQKDGNTTMTMFLDVFPEVEILNSDWEKEKLAHIHPVIEEEEIDQAVMNIKKNFAEYKDVEEITLDSISKIAMEFIDTDGKSLETGHNYVGEQEFAEGDFYQKTFLNKKRGESREISYKEKDLPAVYHYKKTEWTPKHIKLTVQDCKKVVLPELTEAMMLQLFGKESTVKNEAQLRDFIRDTLAQQKFEADLVKSIEDLLQKVKTESMQVLVPRTLIEEEFSTRMKSLQERFGGQEKLTTYFQQMGDEKGKAFLDDIKRAAKESLEKFFILQKMVEALKIDINWEKPETLEVERKLYEKLGEDHEHGHHHDHDHHEHHEEKAEKKTPAKKKSSK